MADIGKLMQQAQQLQADMEKAQKELETMKVRGTAGGDLAMVTLNGKYACLDIKLSSGLMKETTDIIEDTIAAAFNDAARKVEKESRGRMAQLASGLNLPTGFGGGDTGSAS